MSHVYPSYNRSELSFEKGEGPWLFERDGRRFFDFGAGIAVNALGHANPKLAATLKAQADQLWHVSNLYTIPEQENLAKQLCEISFGEYVFFTNSGAESMECAIKTAWHYHYAQGQERHKFITFNGAFHGRTIATITAAGSEKLVKGFGPLPTGFVHADMSETAVSAALDDNTAAIIIEPIQGEGGIRAVPAEFLKFLRKEADKAGALLIFDEVQCGLGRTGTFFAYERAGVEPDIMALAKGIGGGFPLGACVANKKTGATMTPGTHGSTYGGNPLASAIGNTVISTLREEGFLEHVNRLASHAQQRLAALIDLYPDVFEELRGEGLMLGLKTKIPNTDFVNLGREIGVLTVPASENVVRLLPPLNLTIEELDQGIALIENTAQKLSAKE